MNATGWVAAVFIGFPLGLCLGACLCSWLAGLWEDRRE